MAEACVICGKSPTVKSHLWPRALSHDLRRDDKHLVSGRAGDPDIEFLQSGRWRRFLCSDHEDALKEYDDYGVRFVRRVRDRRPGDFRVDNPKPSLLKRFVLAIIWRSDAGWRADGFSSELGQFEPKIRATLFDGADIDAPLFFIQSNMVAAGDPVEIAMEPTKARLRDATVWKFGFGSIDCMVKLSNHAWPAAWAAVDAGRQTEAIILVSRPNEITESAAYRPLLEQMQVFQPKGRSRSARNS